MEGQTIGIRCMDYRENHGVEQFFNQHLEGISIRTAGARVTAPLLREINSLKPKEIIWTVHANCGANGAAYEDLSSDVFPRDPVVRHAEKVLGNVFMERDRMNMPDRETFDAKLFDKGRNRLHKEFAGVSFSAQVTGIGELAKYEKSPDAEKVLVLADDISARPSQLMEYAEWDMRKRRGVTFNIENLKVYIIQAPPVAVLTESQVRALQETLDLLRGGKMDTTEARKQADEAFRTLKEASRTITKADINLARERLHIREIVHIPIGAIETTRSRRVKA